MTAELLQPNICNY